MEKDDKKIDYHEFEFGEGIDNPRSVIIDIFALWFYRF